MSPGSEFYSAEKNIRGVGEVKSKTQVVPTHWRYVLVESTRGYFGGPWPGIPVSSPYDTP